MQNYKIISLLGKGAYGKVYHAIKLLDGEESKEIALKVFDNVVNPNAIAILEQEVNFLRDVSQPKCNPFIVCYYGSMYDETKLQFLIEMEYVEGLDMLKFIKKLKRTNSPEMVNYYLLLITKDLAAGLKYIHSKDIIHNDIKPENIIIDKTYTPRITDFGLSCSPRPAMYSIPFCETRGGTPYYMPPEYFNKGMRYKSSDMWSLGIALYVCATGKFPYIVKDFTELANAIKELPAPQLKTTNDQLNMITNGLLNKTPSARLTPDLIIEMLTIIPRPPEKAVVPDIAAKVDVPDNLDKIDELKIENLKI